MISWLTTIYGKLPEGAKQAPAGLLLIIAVTTYISGKWMSSAACQALRDADQKELTEVRTEMLLYRGIALKGVIGDEQVAKDSLKKVEQVAPTKKPAAVVIKTQPVTPSEKAAVEKPSQATDPASLAQRQSAAQVVLKKVEPAGATVAPVKGTKP